MLLTTFQRKLMSTALKYLTFLAILPLLYIDINAQLLPIELIENRDFEQGNVWFESDYEYRENFISGNNQYSIGRNPKFVFARLVYCGDHTSGSGLMLIADGSPDSRNAVWKKTIDVKRNGSYEFSFWATRADSIDPEEHPIGTEFFVTINGDTLDPKNDNWVLDKCDWVQFKFRWTAYNTDTALIKIRSHTINGWSNDFAIDDLSFRPYCNVIPDCGDDMGICFGNPVEIGSDNHLGAGDLIYEWTPTEGLSDPAAGMPLANPTQTTKYYLKITDEYGCSNTDSVIVYYSDFAVDNLAGDDGIICRGESTRIGGSVSGGVGKVTIEWTPNYFINSTSDINPTVTPDQTTMYYITASDEGGCIAKDSVLITVYDYFQPEISHDGELVLCPCDSIELTCNQADHYLWSTNETTQTIFVKNPGEYSVTAYNDGTCESTTSVTVTGFEGTNLVRVDSLAAKIGDTVDINLFYYSGSDEYDCKLFDFSAKIRFNKSVLYPITDGLEISIEGDDKIVTLTDVERPDNLFRAIVVMGDEERSPIIIEELDWPCTDQEQNLRHGEIYVTDLCQHDTTRLFVDTDEFMVTMPSPHPVEEYGKIGITLIEDAPAEIVLMDLLGNEVKSVAKFSGAVSTEVNLETFDLAPGTYIMVLKTRNKIVSRPIQIAK